VLVEVPSVEVILEVPRAAEWGLRALSAGHRAGM
jgi:hypothetical protein